VNYGVRPDGSKDFPELPAGYDIKSAASHFESGRVKTYLIHGKNSRILHCFGLLKVDGFLTWPKWFLSSELYELSDKKTDAFLLASL
jgi:hypothetical protein